MNGYITGMYTCRDGTILPYRNQYENWCRIYRCAYDNACMGTFPFIIEMGTGIQLSLFDNQLNEYYETARTEAINDFYEGKPTKV